MQIKLTNLLETKGFKEIDQNLLIYCRGYAEFSSNIHYKDKFIKLIISHYRNHELFERMKKYSGCWQFVIIDKKQKKIVIVNDRWGSFPLFYYNTDELFISNYWKNFIDKTKTDINRTAALELSSLGYVLGNKTLLSGVMEFPAHTYTKISYSDNNTQFKIENYWQFNYHHQPANEKEKEIEFTRLWQKRLAFYCDFLNESNSGVYLPFSGGLDCRLLANELDKHGIRTTALTYGLNREYKEIDSAIQAFSLLNHKSGHYLEYLTESTIRNLKASLQYPDPLTCAHFGQMMMDYHSQVVDEFPYIMTGFTGDLVGGSLIKNKMLKWHSTEQIVSHIINLRSAPLYKHFINHPEYKENLLSSLKASIPQDSNDIISAYVRWFVENDARRYLIRSIIPHDNHSDRILLPFFDYEIFDFFLSLPQYLLINKRLYVNSQIKYLFNNNPQILRVKRAKPFRKVKLVGNRLWEEYYPKLILKSGIPGDLKREKKTLAYNKMDWLDIYDDLKLPEFFPVNILNHSILRDKPAYIKFFHPVSRVFKELGRK